MVGSASAGEARPGGGLGPWVLGPLLGLAVVWLAVSGLPAADCGWGDHADPSLPRAELILAMVGASAMVAAAALWRLRELHAAGRELYAPGVLALAVFATFVVLVRLLVPELGRELLWAALAAGVLVTGATLLILLVAWASGRGPDAVGILVPAYLFGAALCCYPFLGLFALAVNNGAFC